MGAKNLSPLQFGRLEDIHRKAVLKGRGFRPRSFDEIEVETLETG